MCRHCCSNIPTVYDRPRFDGYYAATDLMDGDDTYNDEMNSAWHVQATYEGNGFELFGGYREIEPRFGAFGDWGRIGLWWNPTDLEAYNFGIYFKLSPKLAVAGSYEHVDQMTGSGEADIYQAKLRYVLNKAWNARLGFEQVELNTIGEFTQNWYSIGFDYDLGAHSIFMIDYIVSDMDMPYFGDQTSQPRFESMQAGLLRTQLSIKF